MSLISVLTPVDPDRAEHLAQTWESIAAQELPPGWELEWVVVVDGAGDVADNGAETDAALPLRRSLPDDPRIVPSAVGASHGPAVGRTLAAARARGELYKVLDADDVLTSGQLAREIDVLTLHPDVGWVACRALDLHPDGSLHPWSGENPEPGRQPRGAEFDRWIARDHSPSILPSTCCARADLIWRVGGWMALDGGEDTALLLALDALADGWFLDEVGLHYRQWDRQLTRSEEHHREPLVRARAEAIDRRIRALRTAPVV